MPPVEARPGLFLDRDGILNELVFYETSGEWESPRTPADLRIVPGAGAVLRQLTAAGWPLFLVSNQPGVAKGKASLEDLQAIHADLEQHFLREGVVFTAVYYCRHHPEGVAAGYSGPCPCRKPSPYFLRLAAEAFGLDLAASWMVGDQDMDVLCAHNAGCGSVLIPCAASAHKRGGVEPDVRIPSLAQLPEILLMSPFQHRRFKECL